MTKPINREPELGNMKGRDISFTISPEVVTLASNGRVNKSYFSTLAIREGSTGKVTASLQEVHYYAPKHPDTSRSTHVRDSDEGGALLQQAFPKTYPPGMSGIYNPYAEKPIPAKVHFSLDMIPD